MEVGSIFHSIRANRMRSALTALGVVIGIASILVMIGVAEGTNRRLKKEIESLGTNLLLILPGAQTASGARMGSGGVTTLTYEDSQAIAGLGSVRAAAPVTRKVVQVIHGNLNWSTSSIGTTPSYMEVRQWDVARGRFFSESEQATQAKVAVLGSSVVKNVFVWKDPVGQIIRLDRLPFKVIGVLEEKGLSPSGQDQDDVVLVPLKTAQRKFLGITHIHSVLAEAETGRLGDTEQDIKLLLRQRHRIGPRDDDDFSIRNLSEMLAAAQSTSRIMGLMLGAVASISLLVGGIGIMNIMLVSVTERTREIGVRRAIGARRGDIKAQFLSEALVLCGSGGVAGVALGFIVDRLLKGFTPMETYIPLWAVLLSFVFSLAVGLAFGYYPAKKASGLDPITALRYE